MRLRKKCSFFCLPSGFRVFETPMGGAFKPFLEITGAAGHLRDEGWRWRVTSHQCRAGAFGFPRAVVRLGARLWTLATVFGVLRRELTVFLWWPWLCYFLIFSLISIVFFASLLTCKIQQIAEDLPALGVSFTQSCSEPAHGGGTRWAPAWTTKWGWCGRLAGFQVVGVCAGCGHSGVILGLFMCVLRVSINLTWSWELLCVCV